MVPSILLCLSITGGIFAATSQENANPLNLQRTMSSDTNERELNNTSNFKGVDIATVFITNTTKDITEMNLQLTPINSVITYTITPESITSFSTDSPNNRDSLTSATDFSNIKTNTVTTAKSTTDFTSDYKIDTNSTDLTTEVEITSGSRTADSTTADFTTAPTRMENTATETDFTTEISPLNANDFTTSTVNLIVCDSIEIENIFQELQELSNITTRLPNVLKEAIKNIRNFFDEQNYTLAEKSGNFTMNYIHDLKKALEISAYLNKLVKCQKMNDSFFSYSNNFGEYEQRLEISKSLLENINKLIKHNVIKDNDVFKTLNKSLVQAFTEIYSIVDLHVLRKNYSLALNISKTRSDRMEQLRRIISLDKEILSSIKRIEDISKLNELNIFKNKKIKQLLNSTLVSKDLKSNKLKLSYARIDIYEEFKGPAVLFIFILGFIGNGILILVFIRHKEMRTAPNLILMNLVFSDTCILVITFPFFQVPLLLSPWKYGLVACKLYYFSQNIFFGLSVYSVVIISVTRYLILSNSSNLDRGGRCIPIKYIFILNIAFIWVLSAAQASPLLVEAYIRPKDQLCMYAPEEISASFFKQSLMTQSILFVLIPLLIISFTSVISSRKLKQSADEMPGEKIGRENEVKSRILSSKIVIALTVIFAVTYIPYYLYMLCIIWFGVTHSDYLHQYIIHNVTYELVFLNPCINPIALYIVSRNFRKYMNIYVMFVCNFWSKRNTSN